MFLFKILDKAAHVRYLGDMKGLYFCHSVVSLYHLCGKVLTECDRMFATFGRSKNDNGVEAAVPLSKYKRVLQPAELVITFDLGALQLIYKGRKLD